MEGTGSEGSWFCYLVRCRDGSLYVGMTNDLEERVKEHNWGVKSEFTTKRRPVQLMWSERFSTRVKAREREVELKGWSRKKKLKLAEGFARMGLPG